MIIDLTYETGGKSRNCESSLAGAINATVTTLTVTTGEGVKFPTYTPFFLRCESEIMNCTAKATDTFTVVRAQKGTAGASHSSGTPIRAILYTNDLDLDRIITSDGEVLVTDGEVVYDGIS